jgi:hypothetical protein
MAGDGGQLTVDVSGGDRVWIEILMAVTQRVNDGK